MNNTKDQEDGTVSLEMEENKIIKNQNDDDAFKVLEEDKILKNQAKDDVFAGASAHQKYRKKNWSTCSSTFRSFALQCNNGNRIHCILFHVLQFLYESQII